MALNVNWSQLDDTAADALRELLNHRLAGATAKLNGAVQDLSLTGLKWGSEPPFIEIVDIAASRFAQPDEEEDDCDGGQTEHASTALGSGEPSSAAQPLPSSRDWSCESSDDAEPWARSDSSAAAHHSAAHADDALAGVLGDSGICVRLHVTYGGALSVAAECVMHRRVHVTPSCSIGLAVPVYVDVTNVHLDATINIDVHRNRVHVWLDDVGAPLSSLDVVTQIGRGADPDGVCVDAEWVGAVVLAELQALLRERAVFPNCVAVPLGGAGAPTAAA
jgi:hypothetical protein